MKHLFTRIRHKAGKLYRKGKRMLSYTLHKNLFVFGAPYHSNLGDQAQSYCIEKWARKNYPNYKIRILDTRSVSASGFASLKEIQLCMKRSDKVFLHSGYHTTDLYMLEENLQREVVKRFPKKQIVVLPQTIYYLSAAEQKRASEIYNAHHKLLLLCRDQTSFALADSYFPNCRRVLFPDIVTTEIGCHSYSYPRKGILLCVRRDKESNTSSDQLETLVSQLEEIDTVTRTDTTVAIPAATIASNRQKWLEQTWDEYAHYRVVITDRYHGTIFSLIANTPVIVMPSTDHKLQSGVTWFPPEFSDYVQYLPNLDSIPEAVKKVYETSYTYSLPQYFEEKYYSHLKEIIDE